jgi:hypothetical protein
VPWTTPDQHTIQLTEIESRENHNTQDDLRSLHQLQDLSFSGQRWDGSFLCRGDCSACIGKFNHPLELFLILYKQQTSNFYETVNTEGRVCRQLTCSEDGSWTIFRSRAPMKASPAPVVSTCCTLYEGTAPRKSYNQV